MSRICEMTNTYLGSFPRVSGDEPVIGRCAVVLDWFSPRERG